jgi:hypothetical protein
MPFSIARMRTLRAHGLGVALISCMSISIVMASPSGAARLLGGDAITRRREAQTGTQAGAMRK